MKQQFDNTVEKLKTDQLWAITVIDKESLKKVENNATGAFLASKYGSVESFFENLKSSGIDRIQIYDRKKSGSAFRPMSEYSVAFVEKQETEPQPKAEAKPERPVPVYEAAPMFPQAHALNGTVGGLSAPEANFRVFDHSRIQAENIELKAENKSLVKEVEKLKEENLRNELLGTKSVESKNANAEMLKTISESPVLAALASKFMAPGTPPGLGMPEAGLSPVKQQMIASVHHADEGFVNDLFLVARGMSESDEFDTELTALLTKYNLTQ